METVQNVLRSGRCQFVEVRSRFLASPLFPVPEFIWISCDIAIAVTQDLFFFFFFSQYYSMLLSNEFKWCVLAVCAWCFYKYKIFHVFSFVFIFQMLLNCFRFRWVRQILVDLVTIGIFLDLPGTPPSPTRALRACVGELRLSQVKTELRSLYHGRVVTQKKGQNLDFESQRKSVFSSWSPYFLSKLGLLV